jgi:putative ABC transport system substrate-binding protein
MTRPRFAPTRRAFLRGGLALSGLGLLIGCRLPLRPEQSAPGGANRHLIGVLGDSPASRWDALLAGLRELGWIEGQNLAVEYRWIEGNQERYRALTEELVQANVELVVAGNSVAALAAKQATRTVPIVAVLATGEALETGLVDDIARPGGNITGIAGISGGNLASKQLELLKQAVPEAARVAVLALASSSSSTELRIQALQRAAPTLQMQLQVFPVPNPGGLEHAFSAMGRAGFQALQILPATAWDHVWKQIADLAAQHRLPAIAQNAEFPRAGGLLAYGADWPDSFRRAATYVDKILKGARPGDLPMERPTRFDFLVNLRTAEALGLAIPPSVLQQATEAIQ